MSKNITEKKSDEKYLMIQCICNIIGKKSYSNKNLDQWLAGPKVQGWFLNHFQYFSMLELPTYRQIKKNFW